MSTIRFFLNLLEPFRPLAIVLFVAILCSALFESIGIAMLVPLFETILNEGGESQLSNALAPVLRLFGAQENVPVIAVIVLVMFLAKNGFLIATEWLKSKFIYQFRAYWMERIHAYYMRMPYGELVQKKQGTLIDTLITETNKGASGLVNLVQFVTGVVMVTVFYTLLLLAHLEMTLIMTAVALALYFGVVRTMKRYSKAVGKQEIFFQQSLHEEAAENIRATRQIRTFDLEASVIRRFNETLHALTKMLIRWDVVRAIPKPTAEAMIVVLFVGVVMWLQQYDPALMRTLVPTLGVIVIVAQRLFNHLTQLIVHRMVVISFMPVFDLLQRELRGFHSLPPDTQNAQACTRLSDDIAFAGMCFQYPGKEPLFDNVSFQIPHGKTTALIGASGSGKSTIADLLLGLYAPTSGAILVNGIDLETIAPTTWRRMIGFVSQDNFLFHTSIGENIRIGTPEATDEDIQRVARLANAHDFITQFPEGYDTIVGDEGVMLSGGQRQRIAIARALLHNPDILIFDEATSALDLETERAIQQEIGALAKGKTVIIITHRQEVLAHVDRIIRIVDGAVHIEDV